MYLWRVFKLLLSRWRSRASGSAFVWKLALERHFKFLTSPLTHSPWAFQSLWKQNILGSFNSESLFWFSQYKVGCVVPIVIWSEFRRGGIDTTIIGNTHLTYTPKVWYQEDNSLMANAGYSLCWWQVCDVWHQHYLVINITVIIKLVDFIWKNFPCCYDKVLCNR